MTKEFCLRCGRELNGDEMQCPECGKPTARGMQNPQIIHKPVPSSRPRIPVILIVALVIVAMVVMAMPLFNPSSTTSYKTTITVEEISLDDSLGGLYSEEGKAKAFLVVTIGTATKDLPEGKANYWLVPIDKTAVTLTENNVLTFNDTGSNPSITIFFETYLPNYDDGSGAVKSGDYADIFTEKNADREVQYFGTTGVTFDKSDLDESGYVILDGDSQPIGHIKIKVSTEKV